MPDFGYSGTPMGTRHILDDHADSLCGISINHRYYNGEIEDKSLYCGTCLEIFKEKNDEGDEN